VRLLGAQSLGLFYRFKNSHDSVLDYVELEV
jgi:hypothetical protein